MNCSTMGVATNSAVMRNYTMSGYISTEWTTSSSNSVTTGYNVTFMYGGGFAPSKYFEPSDVSLTVQGIFIILLSICCLIFNVMLIMTIKVVKDLRTISNMLILNLAITDVLLAAFVLPSWAATTLSLSVPPEIATSASAIP
jgi:hypothetical protein